MLLTPRLKSFLAGRVLPDPSREGSCACLGTASASCGEK